MGGWAVFDEFALVEEGGEVGGAGGLLHVVGDDGDGVVLFEVGHEVFDGDGGLGVERGAGFVHEEDFGLGGDGAGDAEALLLAAREIPRADCLSRSLTSSQSAAARRECFDDVRRFRRVLSL